MFFVGAYSTFAGTNSVVPVKVKKLEKLGHSRGRAKRFIDEHRVVTTDDGLVRAVVFVLPEKFRLSNDLIRETIKAFKCDWETAKFHCYRLATVDVIGHGPDWPEVQLPASTEAPIAEPVSETAA